MEGRDKGMTDKKGTTNCRGRGGKGVSALVVRVQTPLQGPACVVIYSVSQKSRPEFFLYFFANGWKFLVQMLHAYYTLPSTLDYKFVFNGATLMKLCHIKRDHHHTLKMTTNNNNNNNTLIYIAPACRMTSEALADSSSRATECLTEK